MTVGKIIVVIAIFAASAEAGNIPAFIHICKRTDPEVVKCVTDSVEALREQLKTGIPELEVPGIEPLNVKNIVISSGNEAAKFNVILPNVDVYGASDFQVTKLKLDIPNITYRIGINIPLLRIVGAYNVDARVLVVPIKGEGNFEANGTNCIGHAVLKGSLSKVDGKDSLKFNSLELKIVVGDYSVNLDNLFHGDNAVLSKAANDVLNSNRQELLQLIIPYLEKKISEILLEIANKIVKHVDYDEVFPE